MLSNAGSASRKSPVDSPRRYMTGIRVAKIMRRAPSRASVSSVASSPSLPSSSFATFIAGACLPQSGKSGCRAPTADGTPPLQFMPIHTFGHTPVDHDREQARNAAQSSLS